MRHMRIDGRAKPSRAGLGRTKNPNALAIVMRVLDARNKAARGGVFYELLVHALKSQGQRISGARARHGVAGIEHRTLSNAASNRACK